MAAAPAPLHVIPFGAIRTMDKGIPSSRVLIKVCPLGGEAISRADSPRWVV